MKKVRLMNDFTNSFPLAIMSTLQESTYMLLFIISLIIGSSYGSPVECCKSEIGWRNETHFCNDGSPINLNCSSGECFEVDPNNDPIGRFYVDSLDNLIFINDQNHLTYNDSSDTFCQAHFKGEIRFMVCLPNDLLSISWEDIFHGFCAIVSSFFAAITLIIYWILPEMRDLQDKAMMSLCAAFTVGFFTLGTMKLNVLTTVLDDSTCVFMACLMYYFLLSTFFWMNVISFDIWKSVWFSGLRVDNNALFIVYCFMGWGVPAGFLIFAVVTHFFNVFSIKPGFSEHSCWFNSDYTTWLYFYGPVLILLVVNFIYLGLTVLKLWHIYGKLNGDNIKALRVNCVMCLKLSILMGVTWIFEMIQFYCKDMNGNIQLLFTFVNSLNSLQGLFIFIVLIFLRDKVKKLLTERNVCNIPFPKSWANLKDAEKWEEDDSHEIHL